MRAVYQHARAKINLYLHVTGKREDGYHLLDSLVAFADTGDEISIEPAEKFSFSMTGPFASTLSVQDNLVVRAAHLVCERLGKAPDIHITLTKNLPVSAGIGGGSADAAATVRGLMDYFEAEEDISDILLRLGADVPACHHSKPLRFSGIGETIEPVTLLTETDILLINPLTSCATPDVFRALKGVSKQADTSIPPLENKDALFRFLNSTRNDLTDAAQTVVPAIGDVLNVLRETDARIVRMSGSGATCFGLFDDAASCAAAAQKIKAARPGWWVAASRLQSS